MGEIMGKPAEIREWYKPLSEWNSYCCMEFMSWVANYSEGNHDLKLEEAVVAFRMVMDAGYYEEPERQHNWGWHDPRAIHGSII